MNFDRRMDDKRRAGRALALRLLCHAAVAALLAWAWTHY